VKRKPLAKRTFLDGGVVFLDATQTFLDRKALNNWYKVLKEAETQKRLNAIADKLFEYMRATNK
jgi:hypothetical protein